MKQLLVLVAAALPMAIFPLFGQGSSGPQKDARAQSVHAAPPVSPDRGQQVFEQNCSRCHNPPEGFSPRISGTVALHMRVRASLSDGDYQALLHFLNP